jgi:signal transduction histidine kinase
VVEEISTTKRGLKKTQNYIFDTRNKAVPSISRIREVEEGLEPIGTRLLEDPDEIFNHMRKVIGNASKRLVCSSSEGMQLVYNNFFDLYKRILDKSREGEGEGIRWIINIDRSNIDLVKTFLNAGVQIRHLKNLTPMNFGVDDKYFYAAIQNMEGGKMMQSLFTSNEPVYINHCNSIFEELWKNGIDAVQRIKDIEENADLAEIEVFRSASRAEEVYLHLVKEATKEILFIFPTLNAFIRQIKIGTIGLAEKAAIERNVSVRVLIPANKSTNNAIEPTSGYSHRFRVRRIEQMSETKATILVVDRKESLVMELRDDSKDTFDEAIGLSTYSNSRAGVLSYVSIFENLWKQVELYEDIKLSHEQLVINEQVLREFINVAAHELRTPIQPILGLTEILRSQVIDSKQQEMLSVTIRNAKRLSKLSAEILDVTRLESHTIELTKEVCNLKDIIFNAMDDIILSNEFSHKKLQLSYEPHDILLKVDKSRIAEVLSNLLSNAVKFTSKGTITISVELQNNNNNSDKNELVIVNIQDTGQGIDANMFPRLFMKFASKSYQGTGLGLFISKGIVEAHGGRIWGKNNDNGIGATFSFSLPVTNIS